MQKLSCFRSCLSLGTVALGTALLVGCISQPPTVDAPPPRFAAPAAGWDKEQTPPVLLTDVDVDIKTVALPVAAAVAAPDWAGTYQAMLPCHGCPSVAVSVQLRPDHTAMVRERRLGDANNSALVITYQDPFSFDPSGGKLISLRPAAQDPVTYRFFVAEDGIELRDSATGAALDANNTFRFRKTSLPTG